MDLCSTHAYTPLMIPITDIGRGKSSRSTSIVSKSRYYQLGFRYVSFFRLHTSIVVASLTDVLSLLGKMAGTRKTSFALYSWGARRKTPK